MNQSLKSRTKQQLNLIKIWKGLSLKVYEDDYK